MKKKTMIWLSIIVILIIAICCWMFTGSDKKEQIKYETAKVEEANIATSVTATGTIEPVTSIDVGTQVSGIVSKLYVDYNSTVKKGQVIAELDKTNLTSELNTAKSNLASAQSDLNYQKANFDRYNTLYKKGLVSANDYENALLTYHKAKDAVASSRENVRKAQTNLGYATITSPIDGVILSKEVEEGQTVAASFSTPTLFTIARDLTDMRVIANVDEADIGDVKNGERVSFSVDAYPDDTFSGTVTQVRQEATTTNNVVTYQVVISAPNKNLKLKPGLTANVTIYTLEKSGVISVPSKALRFTPTKELVGTRERIIDCDGKNKVWTHENGIFRAHLVQLGLTDGTRTEILSGIDKGVSVVMDATVTTPETSADNQNATESSPFAPKGPGSNKKKDTSKTTSSSNNK